MREESNQQLQKLQKSQQGDSLKYQNERAKLNDEISTLKAQNEQKEKEIDMVNSTLREQEKAIEKLKAELDQLGVKNSEIRDLNRKLDFQVEELEKQIEIGDNARKQLKRDLDEATEKATSIEEELFESRTI